MDSKYICNNKDKDKSKKVKVCLITTLKDTINTLKKLYKYCNDFIEKGKEYEYTQQLKQRVIKLDSIIKNLELIPQEYDNQKIPELYNKANPNILDDFTLLYLNKEITAFISKNKLTVNNKLIELKLTNVIDKTVRWGKLTQEDSKSIVSKTSQYDIKYINIVSDYPIVINIMSVLYKHLIHILLYELEFFILIQNKKDEYNKFNKINIDENLSIFEKKFKEVLLFFINEINSLNKVYDYNNENFNNLLRACIRIFTDKTNKTLVENIITKYDFKNNNYIVKSDQITKLKNGNINFKLLYELLELKYDKISLPQILAERDKFLQGNVFSFFNRNTEKSIKIPDELYNQLEQNEFIKNLKEFAEKNKPITDEKFLTGKDLLMFLLMAPKAL
jgi:hypothetical protein